MYKLNQYNHNLSGKEIIYDNGNWTRCGRWHNEVYLVNADCTIQHVRTENYWTNQRGGDDLHNGESFVPECDGVNIYINGKPCKILDECSFELLPEHTCKEPRFHVYTFEAAGKLLTFEHSNSYEFCSIAEAKNKWKSFVAEFPEYNFTLLNVKHTA
tara:strand:+ start:239 stop:709 length:471 start_codon:yes stop_codon:yes gene_type:complete